MQLESQPQISDHQKRKNVKLIAAASYATPKHRAALSHKDTRDSSNLMPWAPGSGRNARRSAGFVLFCFVWLATLGVPVVAPGTAAGPFRRVVEAPFWVPSSPVVERGAFSTEEPPRLKTR